MADMPADIYTEAAADPDTLSNLGPLARLAGIWIGERGLDVHPKAEGPRKQAFIERYELQPIDPQTNGPQLYYGLRYHTHITKPGRLKTFHDQIGYWLWEPASGTILHTIAIPRGQVLMAVGSAEADARSFTLKAERGSETFGIVSNPFLEYAFKTTAFEITVTTNDDGTWSYDQTTTLIIPGQAEPFLHTDRNTLVKVGAPTPNPLTVEAARPRQA